ncbi:hypothetical protein GCM10010195_30330 [Kitasatospora griseola]|nr:hypothetical protein GCM10010195_30330 [Kitasatospora griseola]
MPVAAPRPLRLVPAEDSVLLREGLVGLLERFGRTVAAAVGDAPSLLTAVAEHRPDLVVTDVRMPPGLAEEGLRAAVALSTGSPGCRCSASTCSARTRRSCWPTATARWATC